MLKKLFAWKYSGVVIVLLYGLGGVCWQLSSHSRSYRRMFFAAAVLFGAGLVLSLGWIWRNPLFRGLPPEAAKAQSVRRGVVVKPRRGKKNLRRWMTVFSLVLFLVPSVLLERSYKSHAARKERGRIEVYLSDGVRTRAVNAPVLGKAFHSKDLVFALAYVPTKEVGIHRDDKSVRIDVILRNGGNIDFKNAHVEISSNAPIRSGDGTAATVSPNDLEINVPVIVSYRRSPEERVIPVEVPLTVPRGKVGLYIAVTADNLPTVAAVENMHFMELPDAGKPSVLTHPKVPGEPGAGRP